MKRVLYILAIAFSLASCGLNKVVSVNSYNSPSQDVVVYSPGQQLPDNIQRVGSVSIGGKLATRTKDCTYEACLNEIILEAKKVGAQIVYLSQITQPDMWHDTCYRITADLYVYKNN